MLPCPVPTLKEMLPSISFVTLRLLFPEADLSGIFPTGASWMTAMPARSRASSILNEACQLRELHGNIA